MRPANERHYIVTLFLIGWAHKKIITGMLENYILHHAAGIVLIDWLAQKFSMVENIITDLIYLSGASSFI